MALIIFTAGLVPVRAHELRPAIATISFDAAGNLTLVMSVNLEALIANVGPGHDDTAQSPNAGEYDRLRASTPDGLRAAFDRFEPEFLAGIDISVDGRPVLLTVENVVVPDVGDTALARVSVISLAGQASVNAKTLVWQYRDAFGDSVVRLAGAGSEEIIYSVYLSGGGREEIPLTGSQPQSAIMIFADYLVIGFSHIVPKGLDHILFVVGLFLLSTRLKPLLWQVTGFTLAHSVTLALGMLGLVQVSPAIVEPLIAASIVYVAVENIMTDRLQRWRPAVVFGFGLLHGLGFAGVLREIGLAPAHFFSGLVAFNLGVELGQLAVIAGCFLAVGLWFGKKSWYRSRISIPASAVIAAVGFYWFVIRIV